MKSFFTLVAFCLISFCSFAQSASQTVHQAIACTDIEKVILRLDGSVEIKETKGTRILIESTVIIGTPNTALLQYLVDSGRYGTTQETSDSEASMSIVSKKRTNTVMVKGAECSEEIRHIVYIPSHIKFTQDLSSTTASNQ